MYEGTSRREQMAQRRAQEQEQKKMTEKFDQAFAWKMLKVAGAATILNIWNAQLIAWGLSLFGISSGIWGPFLLLEGVGSAFVYVIMLGMMHAVKKTQEVGRNLS